MLQRRPTTPAQYQQVQQVTPDEVKPDVPSLFSTTFTEDAVSRACYLRALDLLTLLGEVLKVGNDNTPAGTAGNVMTGFYKGVTQVALPFWKTGHEMFNHGRFNTKITIAHLLNVADSLLSAASYIAWIYGTATDDKTALAVSKYLLAVAMVMHVLKDTIQKYQISQTQSLEKKTLEKRLGLIEQRHTEIESKLTLFETNQNILFDNDKIFQKNDNFLIPRVQTLEEKTQALELRTNNLIQQRR